MDKKIITIKYNLNSEAMTDNLLSILNTLNTSDPYLCNEQARPKPPVESNVGKQYDFDTGEWKKVGVQQI